MRVENWPSRLAEYIERNRETPFAWGEFDCALGAAGALRAIAEVDAFPEFEALYGDDPAAVDLEAVAPDVLAGLGLSVIEPSRAGRGDLVLVTLPNRRKAMGFVDLTGFWVRVVSVDGGWARYRMDRVELAWKV